MALAHIRDNRVAIDALVEELLETETIDGARLREVLGQYTTIPEENYPREVTMV